MKIMIYLFVIILSGCIRQGNLEPKMNASSGNEAKYSADASFQELNTTMYVNSMV